MCRRHGAHGASLTSPGHDSCERSGAPGRLARTPSCAQSAPPDPFLEPGAELAHAGVSMEARSPEGFSSLEMLVFPTGWRGRGCSAVASMTFLLPGPAWGDAPLPAQLPTNMSERLPGASLIRILVLLHSPLSPSFERRDIKFRLHRPESVQSPQPEPKLAHFMPSECLDTKPMHPPKGGWGSCKPSRSGDEHVLVVLYPWLPSSLAIPSP